MTINLLLLLATFVLGTAVGSFINAWVYRLRHGLPIVASRSICPHCQKQISNIDLIPVLSFLMLGGKCRHCHEKISPQYPVIELLTGLLFAATYYSYFRLTAEFDVVSVFFFATQLIFVTILVTLLLYDLLYMQLPDRVVIPGIILALFIDLGKIALGVWQFREMTGKLPFGQSLLSDQDFVAGHIQEMALPLVWGALAGLALASIFYVIVLLSKERAMGGGDIKLALLLGLILPWPYLLPAMYLGFALGAVVGIILVFLRRKGMRQLIPLAPFLVTGTLAAIFFGDFLYRYLLNFKLF